VWLVWLAFGALNAGVLAQAVSPWLPWPVGVSLVARALELTACLAFAGHAWPRVKPFMESEMGRESG
jgi:hypothetical protein